MAEEKKTQTLEEALGKNKQQDPSASTSTETTEPKAPVAKSRSKDIRGRVDRSIVDQEKRLQKAQVHDPENPPKGRSNPPSSHFPERVSLTEYNENLAEKRRKDLKGKKKASPEQAKVNKAAVAEFSANYENQPFARKPDDWGPDNYRSTPGADDAPAFSTAEKVAGSGTANPIFLEEKHGDAGTV